MDRKRKFARCYPFAEMINEGDRQGYFERPAEGNGGSQLSVRWVFDGEELVGHLWRLDSCKALCRQAY
jgi:hypothetical protein